MRQPKRGQITEQKRLPYAQERNLEDWPDEFDFKVDRWQRSSDKENNTVRDQDLHRGVASKARNLPRSRRRRRV